MKPAELARALGPHVTMAGRQALAQLQSGDRVALRYDWITEKGWKVIGPVLEKVDVLDGEEHMTLVCSS